MDARKVSILSRAVVQQMNGDNKECERLVRRIVTGCQKCGGKYVKAIRRSDDIANHIWLCTDCGNEKE